MNSTRIEAFRVPRPSGRGVFKNWWSHELFTREDDRIELQDTNGNVFLTYTANCLVLRPDGSLYGTFSLSPSSPECWTFENASTGLKTAYTGPILSAEVEVSKAFLREEVEDWLPGGKVPPKTECPYRGQCASYVDGTCNDTSPATRTEPFSCAIARGFDLIRRSAK
jgi:hypothetical protein